MSAVNPVFLLGGALSSRGAELGRAFVGSLTLGSGQFCTNPGLVIAADGPELDAFIAAAGEAVAASAPTAMLTPAIADSFGRGVAALQGEATLIARGSKTRRRRPRAGPRCSPPMRPPSWPPETLQAEVFGAAGRDRAVCRRR